jgi:hypothetical protein
MFPKATPEEEEQEEARIGVHNQNREPHRKIKEKFKQLKPSKNI